tara:strand:+ start:129 stop:1289 length:1161 start_codon:yes stop_codon:yes gene_type:complete
MEQTLTIGMAHHDDFNGVYFTIQDIIKELVFNNRQDLLKKIEFLVIENNPDSNHGKSVKSLEKKISSLRVVDFTDKKGTSATRNKIIAEARTNFVLVLDCHVLLCPVVDTLDRLFTYMEYNSDSNDLFCGPLVHDNCTSISTHFKDTWGGGMWGQWANAWQCVCESFNFSIKNVNGKAAFSKLDTGENIDKCVYCNREFPKNVEWKVINQLLNSEGYSLIGRNSSEKPFEVFAQGLGCFFTRKNAWLGFNEHAEGFGGEECYIHEKYRMNDRKVIYLPFLRWLHRFDRPDGVSYPLTLGNKVRNYVLEFLELNMDLSPIKKHFVEEQNLNLDDYNKIVDECRSIYRGDSTIDPEVLSEIDELKLKLKQLQSKANSKTGKCCKKRCK